MKRVCVVTGSRADYGLLRWVMGGLKDSSKCTLQLIVTGMHLSDEFGSTWKSIEDDGFDIDYKIEMLLGSDTKVAVTKSVGLATIGFADAFEILNPQLLVLLGDRFEILAAATAALVAGIPIAHLHGGELTEGAFDDAIRHSITKMAFLHFTAAEEYRNRVIQMGEDPSRVWNVGGFGLDGASRAKLIDKAQLAESLGIEFGEKPLLVTFHPETMGESTSAQQMDEVLSALEDIDSQLIFTMPNADVDGRIIIAMIQSFVSQYPERACLHASLGQSRYFSLLACISGVVGNSSSGLIEAPYFGVGTVNIGDRQKGRMRASSVIDCAPERKAIKAAIHKLFDSGFQKNLAAVKNPYGQEGASQRTVSIIEDWDHREFQKSFFDFEIPLLKPKGVD